MFNYSYDVPNLSQKWNNLLAKVDVRQLAVLRASRPSRHGTYGGFTYNYANVPTGALSGTGAINGGATTAAAVSSPAGW